MGFIPAQQRNLRNFCLGKAQHRRRIPHAKRCQLIQFFYQVFVHRHSFRHKIIGLEGGLVGNALKLLLDGSLESLPKGRQLPGFQSQSRRLGVAAKLEQVFLAALQCIVQLQRRYASAGAFGRFPLDGQQHRRQMVLFRYPGGHNADNPWVPPFGSQHNAPFRTAQLGQLFFCCLENLLADGLPFLVGRIQLLGQALGFLRVIGGEQLHRCHGVI